MIDINFEKQMGVDGPELDGTCVPTCDKLETIPHTIPEVAIGCGSSALIETANIRYVRSF